MNTDPMDERANGFYRSFGMKPIFDENQTRLINTNKQEFVGWIKNDSGDFSVCVAFILDVGVFIGVSCDKKDMDETFQLPHYILLPRLQFGEK